MDKKSIEEKSSLRRAHGKYELPEFTQQMSCPACHQKDIHLSRTMYTLPDGEDILILLLECDNCGYRKTDTITMYSAFTPGEYHLKVDNYDFTPKIFRGMTGDLEIPEIGITIERGPAANFDFTNIEGILEKIEHQLNFFLASNSHESREWMNANEALKRLKKAQKGKLNFTIILRDTEGGSYISPTDPKKLEFHPYNKNGD